MKPIDTACMNPECNWKESDLFSDTPKKPPIWQRKQTLLQQVEEMSEQYERWARFHDATPDTQGLVAEFGKTLLLVKEYLKESGP